MDLIDFSRCEIDRRSDYGGSDRKKAIFYNGDRYMLKFSEKSDVKNDYGTSHVNNVLFEYLGSHIVASTGIPTHETLLGTYNGELVVACKNFLGKNEVLHEFSWYMRTQFDSGELERSPKLMQIYSTILNDPDLASIQNAAKERYWDTFVADSIIGNFDRHSGNWGYIIGEDDSIRLAPVYDCGSCLYPNLSADKMPAILQSDESIAKRIYGFPKAALLIVEKNKVGYYDMMASGFNKDCSAAVLRMAPRINLDAINEIIDNAPTLNDVRKEFYKTMISKRKEFIVDRAASKIRTEDYDTTALSRIGEAFFKDTSEALAECEKTLGE